MKKIFLIISLALAAVSCDPENVFVDADESVECDESVEYKVKEVDRNLKVVTYDGHDYLVFIHADRSGPSVVHSESCKCKKHE